MDLSKLGRRLSDIEAEFAFGDIPESNIGPSDGELLDADAVNDETFGVDMGPSNVELEDYAAQTACLRMDDGWEQPGCSATAPDASQLPMPQFDIAFGRSSFDAFSNEDILPATGSSLDKMDALWNTSTNGVFNLWGGGNSTGNQSKKMTEQSFGNFDLPSVDLPKSRPEAEIRRPAPPPMPIEAHTLDELERLYVEATSEKVVPQCEFETSSLSALSVAINVADLEKSISEDVVKSSKHEIAHQMPSVGTGLPFSPIGIPPGPLPFFPPVPPMFMPFMGVWMDFLSGKIPFLPPGFPPVPPPVFVMFRHMRSGMPPGIGPICPPHAPMGPQAGGVQHGHSDWQRRPLHRRVAPGMPSGKTIEDFAFDPYAGFMSCKEREWLVRIQILQCQGQTGDPFEDDYYYASWREKRLAAGWRPKTKESIRENGEKGRTMLREKDRNRGEDRDRNREYKAPKFAGSLGKPVTSTVYNPRHLIDVSGDNQEDKKSATQKKLRTMLLKLESAAILLMDCVDKRRPLTQQPHIAEKVASDISERVNLVIKELFTVDQISKTVQLTKGRTVLRKLLAIALPKQLVQIIITLFGALSGFQKKTYTELSSDLLPTVHITLSRFPREQLMYVTSTVDGRLMKDAIEQKNAFARDILFVLLLWVARRRATSSDSIFQWLRSRDEVQWNGDGWSHPIVVLTSLIHLNTEDIANISEWLRLLSADPKAVTVASRLASALSP